MHAAFIEHGTVGTHPLLEGVAGDEAGEDDDQSEEKPIHTERG